MLTIRPGVLVLTLSAFALAGSSCQNENSMSGPTTSGAMNVQITGLASTSDANITVTRADGVSQLVMTSETLSGLTPGLYTVTAQPVLTGQAVMVPTTGTQNATVVAAQTITVTVSYTMQSALSIRLVPVVPASAGLSQPIFLASPPGDMARLFIAERPGRIRIVQNGQLLATPFVDVSGRTSIDGERGLLSFAFHPQFAQTGLVFVHHTDAATGDIVVERFAVSTNPNVADPNSAIEVIRIAHRTASNHNGGTVAFGADGTFFLSTGDGGGGNERLANPQDVTILLGKMLRLDVSTLPYSIPADNPFGNEVWARGLRNPFRWAFDRAANRLYIADVGENTFEEVDAVAAGAAGVNYGWPIMEGTACFLTNPCTTPGLTLPVFEYDHTVGCAIIGGFAYRGNAIPDLQGRYFFSDYCAGFVRSFLLANGQATERVDWNVPSIGAVLSFGQDANGELYVLAADGNVYQIVKQ